MLNIACPRCSETFSVPDDLTQGHCVRCGQVVTLIQSPPAVASAPAENLAVAFQEDGYGSPLLVGGATALAGPPERYESWDEFRAASPAVQRELLNLATRAMPDLRRVHIEPIPEDAPAEIESWGRPLGTIDVSGENQPVNLGLSLVYFGVGVLLAGGGVAAMMHARDAREGPNWAAVLLPLFFGVGFIVLAAWVTFFRQSNLATTVWIFEEGAYLRRFASSRAVPWEMIRDFESSTESGKLRYRLALDDEWSVLFMADQAPEMMPLLEYVDTRLSAAQFLKRLEAIWRGQRMKFGVVALNREGLEYRGMFARWSEVRRVVCDAKTLFVDWSQRPEWVPIRYQDVSFPYLVIAISHVLIDEHSRLGPANA